MNTRNHLRSLVAGLGLAASTTLLISCGGSPGLPSALSSAPVKSASGFANQVASATQSYRTSKGRSALSRNSTLDGLATQHAQTMARTGQVNHAGWAKRTGAAGSAGIGSANENVWRGLNQDTSQLTSGAMNYWSNSTIHNTNLLDRNTTDYGVGAAKGADGYYNVVFISGAKR